MRKKPAPRSKFDAARLSVALRETIGGEIVTGSGTDTPGPPAVAGAAAPVPARVIPRV